MELRPKKYILGPPTYSTTPTVFCQLMERPKTLLEDVKDGFSKLKKSTDDRRKALLDCLARKEKLSDDDERWLDTDGNLVDEFRIINILEAASDFEQAVGRLSDEEMAILHRLRGAAKVENVGGKDECELQPYQLEMANFPCVPLTDSFEKPRPAPHLFADRPANGKRKPGPFYTDYSVFL